MFYLIAILVYIYIFLIVMMWSFYNILDDLSTEPTPIANFVRSVLWPIFLPIVIGRIVGAFSCKYL